MHTSLSITRGTDGYSTIFILGTPSFGIPDKQWRALGDLAAKIRAEQLLKVHGRPGHTWIPANRPGPGAGWSITAPTEDIAAIESEAQDILQGMHGL